MSSRNLTFSVGGIHFDEHKELSEKCQIETMPEVELVAIPMSQHIGAANKPIVKVGDHVKMGQKI